jgi:hypothetical protein
MEALPRFVIPYASVLKDVVTQYRADGTVDLHQWQSPAGPRPLNPQP